MSRMFSLEVKKKRYQSMCSSAKKASKPVPTFEYFEKMLDELNNFSCPTCQREMTWNRINGNNRNLTLQHDRSGKIRLICMACNLAHASLPGDTFYDNLPYIPKSVKAQNSNKTRAMAFELWEEARTELGLTRKQLAELSNVSLQWLNDFINDGLFAEQVTRIKRIEKVLHIHLGANYYECKRLDLKDKE